MTTELLAVNAAMKQMLEHGYVDICAIDKSLRLLGIPAGGRAYSILSALHCIHFAKMEPQLRALIPELLDEAFGETAMVWTLEPAAAPSPGLTGWRRLLP